MKPECKDCAEYASEFCKDCLKEEMTTTAAIPNPADTAMGPKFKTHNVTDRRRRKDKVPVVLKRFRKYMQDNA